jgi:hypothetical protein
MRKAIALTFALFGFASQASAEPYRVKCTSGDGDAFRTSRPCHSPANGFEVCEYSHTTQGGEEHRFSKTVRINDK